MQKIRKMDELEVNISQSSIKVSYLVTTLILALASLYDILNDHKFSFAGILLCVNILVFLVSHLILGKKYELLKNSTYIFVGAGSIVIVAIVVFVGFFLNR